MSYVISLIHWVSCDSIYGTISTQATGACFQPQWLNQ